ncbi:MAG: aminoglycoside phosphotransferase, partial [Chromatiales bacterium]
MSIESGSRPDSRLDQLTAWLRESLGAGISDPVPASSDASFRRYFRLRCGDASYIAMDAPPEREASRPFVEIALRLGMHGVKV